MITAPIDHVVIAGERLDAQARDYERLGFRLTDRGEHRELGTDNRLIVLDDIYVELLGVPPDSPLRHGFGAGSGLVAAAWRSTDPVELQRHAQQADLPLANPVRFQREVTDQGSRIGTASFTVTMATGRATPGWQGAFFCQHHTPALVFRDEWRTHPNGVTGLKGFILLTDDPRRAAAEICTTFAGSPGRETQSSVELSCGRRTWLLATRDHLLNRFPGLDPASWRSPLAVGLSLFLDDPPALRHSLTALGVATYDSLDGGFAVAPAHAAGVLLELVPSPAQRRGRS